MLVGICLNYLSVKYLLFRLVRVRQVHRRPRRWTDVICEVNEYAAWLLSLLCLVKKVICFGLGLHVEKVLTAESSGLSYRDCDDWLRFRVEISM